MKPPPQTCKLLVVGESDVGKTAIVHKYVNCEFREKIQSTVCVDVSTATCTVDNKTINLQIWDTAGQERYHAIGNAFYRNSDACLLVYDITNKDSFEQIDKWRSEVIKNVGDPSLDDDGDGSSLRQFPFLILGNKNDKEDERKVPICDAEKYAQDHGCSFYEVSAKSGVNIIQAFQKIAEKFRDYNRENVASFQFEEQPEPSRRRCC